MSATFQPAVLTWNEAGFDSTRVKTVAAVSSVT